MTNEHAQGMPEDRLRSQAEIVRLHDLLGKVVNGEAFVRLPEGHIEAVAIALGVLCWTLQHPAGEGFGQLVDSVKQLLALHGYDEDGNRRDGSASAAWN